MPIIGNTIKYYKIQHNGAAKSEAPPTAAHHDIQADLTP